MASAITAARYASTLLAQDPESHARRLVAQLLNARRLLAVRMPLWRSRCSRVVTAAQLAPVPLDTRRTL